LNNRTNNSKLVLNLIEKKPNGNSVFIVFGLITHLEFLTLFGSFTIAGQESSFKLPNTTNTQNVCVLNQPVKAGRMLYKRWKPFGGGKTKAEAERTEPRNHYHQERGWTSADDFQE